jgi:hypothetical protein
MTGNREKSRVSLLVKTKPSGACVLCTSHRRSKSGTGYPEIRINGKTSSVVHFLWEEEKGPIPDGLLLHNLCGDKRCINLDHYELITLQELTQKTCLRGEEKFNAKLTEDEARNIKRSSRGYKYLAEVYGVSWSTIRNIKKGKRWKHIA